MWQAEKGNHQESPGWQAGALVPRPQGSPRDTRRPTSSLEEPIPRTEHTAQPKQARPPVPSRFVELTTPPGRPPGGARLSTLAADTASASWSSAPQVRDDGARGVQTRQPRDLASRVGARAARVQPLDLRARSPARVEHVRRVVRNVVDRTSWETQSPLEPRGRQEHVVDEDVA